MQIYGYELVKCIGRGGVSTVYEALDPAGRRVAFKRLHPAVAAEPAARARLRREIAMLQRISGSGVAQIIDAEIAADEVFIVTELVEGLTLEKDVEINGIYTEEDLLRLGQELQQILENVHRAGVLHRDIKPANVMIGKAGPVLIDFGISQLGEDTRLTQQGFLAHTPGYCDPQVLQGASPDKEADWWALAAVLAYAATGSAPFGKGNASVIMQRVLHSPPYLPGLSSALQAAFCQALAVDFTQRISYAELLEIIADPHQAATLLTPLQTPQKAEQPAVAPTLVAETAPNWGGSEDYSTDSSEYIGNDGGEYGEEYGDTYDDLYGDTDVDSYGAPNLPATLRSETALLPPEEANAAPRAENSLARENWPMVGNSGADNLLIQPGMALAENYLPALPHCRLQILLLGVVSVFVGAAAPIPGGAAFLVILLLLDMIGTFYQKNVRYFVKKGRRRDGWGWIVMQLPISLPGIIVRSVFFGAIAAGIFWVLSWFFSTYVLDLQNAVLIGIASALAVSWNLPFNARARLGSRWLWQEIAPEFRYQLLWWIIGGALAGAAYIFWQNAPEFNWLQFLNLPS